MKNFNIKYRNMADAINNEMNLQAEKALDEIFFFNSSESKWIQPTLKSKSDLINAVKLASDKIESEKEALIIVVDGELKNLLEFMLIASDSNREIYFLGDSLSTLEYSKAIKAMNKNDFSIIAISDGNESTEMICAFTLARKALFKKYSLEKAQEKIYMIAPNGSSYFMKEAAENKYVRLHYEENVTAPEWLITPAFLLPVATMGYNIEEIVDGYEEMATSLIWDNDGSNLANIMARYTIKTNYSEVEFKPFIEYIERRLEMGFSFDDNKDSAILDFSLEETNRDIITPVFPGCNPEGSMKLMAEDFRARYLDESGEKGYPIIEIRLKELNSNSLGQLLYFMEITIAIKNRINNLL